MTLRDFLWTLPKTTPFLFSLRHECKYWLLRGLCKQVQESLTLLALLKILMERYPMTGLHVRRDYAIVEQYQTALGRGHELQNIQVCTVTRPLSAAYLFHYSGEDSPDCRLLLGLSELVALASVPYF